MNFHGLPWLAPIHCPLLCARFPSTRTKIQLDTKDQEAVADLPCDKWEALKQSQWAQSSRLRRHANLPWWAKRPLRLACCDVGAKLDQISCGGLVFWPQPRASRVG